MWLNSGRAGRGGSQLRGARPAAARIVRVAEDFQRVDAAAKESARSCEAGLAPASRMARSCEETSQFSVASGRPSQLREQELAAEKDTRFWPINK